MAGKPGSMCQSLHRTSIESSHMELQTEIREPSGERYLHSFGNLKLATTAHPVNVPKLSPAEDQVSRCPRIWGTSHLNHHISCPQPLSFYLFIYFFSHFSSHYLELTDKCMGNLHLKFVLLIYECDINLHLFSIHVVSLLYFLMPKAHIHFDGIVTCISFNFSFPFVYFTSGLYLGLERLL